MTDIDEVALVPNMDGFDATEVCPITSDFMGSQDNMVSNFDVVGADLGISVVDPIAGSHSTFVFFGDTVPNNSNGWGAGDMTGYFPSGQFKFLCQGFRATTLSGSLSTVFAPNVMVEPTWAPIGTFVNQPVPAPSGQSIAPGAAVPGSFEVPTGAFAHDLKNGDHNIYLFYTTNNGTASSPNLDSSYLAVWKNPSASVASKKPPDSPNTYRILSEVDNLKSVPPNLGGHFINVAPVVDEDNNYLYLFGTGAYRASGVFLARMSLDDVASIGKCASPPCSLAQIKSLRIWSETMGTEKWRTPTAATIPYALTSDTTVGELSVRQVKEAGLWLMMYAPLGAHETVMLWSLKPTGPWSSDQPVINLADPGTQSLYCCQGTQARTDKNGLPVWSCLSPDGLAADQQIAECDEMSSTTCSGGGTCGIPGTFRNGLYAPYMLPDLDVNVTYLPKRRPHVTQVDSITVHFLLSSFEPYGSVYFTANLQATIPLDP